MLGAHGLLQQRTTRVVARAREAARTAHLGAAPQERHGPAAPHARPGQGQQTVQTDTGPLALAIPRDRHGSGAPPRVPPRQRRREGCEAPGWRRDARGLSPRENPGPRAAWEGTEGAPTRIATLTAAG